MKAESEQQQFITLFQFVFFSFPSSEFNEHQPLPFISILAVASYRIAVQNNKMLHHKTKTESVKKSDSLARSVSVSLSFLLSSFLHFCASLHVCGWLYVDVCRTNSKDQVTKTNFEFKKEWEVSSFIFSRQSA